MKYGRLLAAAIAVMILFILGTMEVSAVPPDTDGDGFADAVELSLGSNPADPSSTPEHATLPLTCGDGVDNDGDGLIDGLDPGCGPAPPVIYKGLEHTPLGAATLTPVGDTLVVGNIGSSGEDGVAVDIGDVSLWAAEMPSLGDDPIPDGAVLELTSRGTIADSPPNQIISVAHYEDVGSRVQATLDFSPTGATSLTSQFFVAGSEVHTETEDGSSVAHSFLRWPDDGGITGSCCFPPEIDAEITWSSALTVETQGGAFVAADLVHVVTNGPVPAFAYSKVEMTAADIPSITITDESVVFPAVGGIAELPDVDTLPQEAAERGGGSAPLYAAIAGGLGAAVLAIAAGGWYARRRWLH